MTLRIGFDARWYNRSGVGTYVAELLSAMAKIPGRFEIVAFENIDNPLPAIDGTRITRVRVPAGKFSTWAQLQLRHLCESEKIEIFHCPYQYGAPMFLPCPLVVTIHDLTPFFLSTRSWLKQLFAVPLVKAGYRATAFRASHIITDSMNTARDVQDVLKIPPDRITPVHLAAAERHFHPRESGSDPAEAEFILAKYSVRRPFILVSSAENWRIKNLQTALRALAITRQLSPTDFETVIYGPSNGIEALTASQPSLARNIRNVGYVPTEDLAALFRNAELFITSSLYEGFGLPILEAMSCGCPVVTSNGGSLAEVAGKGAQVFDPMDAEGMAGAVAELLSDSGARLRWSKRAQDRAREFSWRKTAEQTLAVYCHVLGRQTTFHSDFAHCYDDQNARAQKSA